MVIYILIAAIALLSIAYALFGVRSAAALKRVQRERSAIYRNCFLNGLAGLLAKMSQADGAADALEQAVADRLFRDMGISEDEAKICTESFAAALKSDLPGSYYASLFAPYSTQESRLLLYEILWDIAAADGAFAAGEDEFLRKLVGWLDLDPEQYRINLQSNARKFQRVDEAVHAGARRIAKICNESLR